MHHFLIASLVLVIIALALVALLVARSLKNRIGKMKAEANEANTGYIEMMQEFEHQTYLMRMLDEIIFSLLGMPDNDLEQFDNYLLRGLQTISQCGECEAISVYRNRFPVGEK